MPAEILNKAWRPEELGKVGKDAKISTLFMNQLNFTKDTIKLYPYDQRKLFIGIHGDQKERFYGTDKAAATWFFQQRFGVKPEKIKEATESQFTSPQLEEKKPIELPKAKLSHPVVVFNGDCFDKESLSVIVEAMDNSINTAYKTLQRIQLQTGKTIMPGYPHAKTLSTLRAIRDDLSKAPLCEEKIKKTLKKPAPRKTPVVEPPKETKKPAEPVYIHPFTRVVDASTRKLKYYQDAEGKIIPRELWPKQF